MSSLLDLTVRPLESAGEREWCAQLMASSEPWLTLGRTVEQSRRLIQDPSREVYLAVQGIDAVGFIILTLAGPFPGYVQTVCVSPEHRGRGVGTQLLAFAEERIFRKSPNVFLCVSSFNVDARRLYERLGYVLVGELKDYVVAGHSELLLRKTRGPLSEFSDDPYDLDRFVRAQAADYDRALSELRDGRKRSHWMWYVFPQIEGLGNSPMSHRYSIKSAAEARAYLGHPILGPRLRECAAVVLSIVGRSALEIFGSPDELKLRSCATLFARVSDDGVFEQVLTKYFKGQHDSETLRRLRE